VYLSWITISMKPLSIYVHIPFCRAKCNYCDFLSFTFAPEAVQRDYVKALLLEIEIEAAAYRDYEVRTVFIGGGTPSLLSVEDIKAIISKLRKCYCFADDIEPEITIEVNPGTVTDDILCCYRELGINRLSFGVQSADDNELKLLGRIHTFEEFLGGYHSARKHGFNNINVDIIFSLPSQTLSSWTNTIEQIVKLEPEHISAYSLIIEPDTPFYDLYSVDACKGSEIIDDETDRDIYRFTKGFLNEYNYTRYEISNYAKNGYECMHNITYWRRGDYVGFGLGAASMINNTRWSNIGDLKSYIMIYLNEGGFESAFLDKNYDESKIGKQNQGTKIKLHALSLKEQIEEYLFLGLRLTDGVNLVQFKSTFNNDLFYFYKDILNELKENKLINIDNTVTLTDYGIDISNYVMSRFLFE